VHVHAVCIKVCFSLSQVWCELAWGPRIAGLQRMWWLFFGATLSPVWRSLQQYLEEGSYHGELVTKISSIFTCQYIMANRLCSWSELQQGSSIYFVCSLMHLARRAGRVSVPWGVSQNRTLSSSPLRQKKNLFAVGWRSWVPAHDDVHLISGNGPTEQNDGHGHQDQKTRVRVLNLVFHHPTFLTALRVSWCC